MNMLLELYPGDTQALLVANVLVQVSVVILLAWVLARAVARHNAAAREAIWLCALVCVLLSPVAAWTADRAGWSLVAVGVFAGSSVDAAVSVEPDAPLPEVLPASRPRTELDIPQIGRPVSAGSSVSGVAEPGRSLRGGAQWHSTADRWRAVGGAAFAIWTLGLLYFAGRLLHGWWTLKRLRRQLEPVDIPAIPEILEEIRTLLGVGKLPRIVTWRDGESRIAPFTAGVLGPLVVVPGDLVRSCPREGVRDVLLHECAHAARRDPVVGLLQRLVEALFWPYPLVRLMNRELAQAREEICDNYVLRQGDGSRYAHTLLELSEGTLPLSPKLAELALLRPSWRLEQRVAGLLDARRSVMIRINRWVFGASMVGFLGAAVLIAGTRMVRAESESSAEPSKRADAKLLGPVQVEFLEGMDVLVVRGHQRDVEKVTEVIRQIGQVKDKIEPAENAAGGLTYRCRVTDRVTGEPIEGATVTVRRSIHRALPESYDTLLLETRHRTDAQGRYTLEISPERAAQRFLYIELDVEHPDYAGRRGFGYALSMIRKNEKIGDRPFFEHVRMWLGKRVAAQVVTPDGKPAVGVDVLGYSRPEGEMLGAGFSRTTTDQDGRFTMTMATPGNAVFWLEPDQFAPSEHVIHQQRGDLGVIGLQEGIVVRGKLLDADGEPVAGISVEMRKRDIEAGHDIGPVATQICRAALTNRNGEFVLKPLPPAEYTIRVREYLRGTHDGRRYHMPAVFLERQMTLTKGELPEPVVLQALPHVTVTAQYVDSAGKPSSGHSQSLTGKLGDQYWWGRGSPDAGGKMVILAPRGLAEAKLNLVNNEHGAYRAQRDKDSPLESTRDLRLGTLTEDVPGILIHRYKAPMVVARVLAKDGGELKNVEVTGLYAGHDDPNAYRPYFESDASDGRIRTSQMLPDEELTITATADGYGPRTKKLKLPEGEILETEFVLAKE